MADTKYLCILSILREQFHYCHITHLYISTWGSRPPSRRPLLGPSGRESPWGRCPASPRPRSRGPARAPARSGGPAQRGRLTSSAASSLETHDALLAVALARGVSRGQHGLVVGGPRVHSGLRILQSYHAASCLVLRSIHRFHNWFSHNEDTMLTNPSVPYDFSVGVPISRLLTMHGFSASAITSITHLDVELCPDLALALPHVSWGFPC